MLMLGMQEHAICLKASKTNVTLASSGLLAILQGRTDHLAWPGKRHELQIFYFPIETLPQVMLSYARHVW